ncbi:cupin domain-containing protein [Bradyrhizobium ottawaense]|uniref:cupin domain-containing protein n=1 Tax=Bradyrhizobium ottawaense TaxID=931866 RepID=UPI00384DA661
MVAAPARHPGGVRGHQALSRLIATLPGTAALLGSAASGGKTMLKKTLLVLEGELNLLIDGQPEKTLKAGDSYQIPAGVVHDAKAHGDKAMKVLGVYVVDKTKPLASPAP